MKIQTQFAVVQRGLHEYRLVGSVNDVLAVEDDLAKAVAREIRVRLTPQTQAELPQSHPVNPKAFDAYLQGYYYFERKSDKDTAMGAKYFERATQLDPRYALVWVWLSRARRLWRGAVLGRLLAINERCGGT